MASTIAAPRPEDVRDIFALSQLFQRRQNNHAGHKRRDALISDQSMSDSAATPATSHGPLPLSAYAISKGADSDFLYLVYENRPAGAANLVMPPYDNFDDIAAFIADKDPEFLASAAHVFLTNNVENGVAFEGCYVAKLRVNTGLADLILVTSSLRIDMNTPDFHDRSTAYATRTEWSPALRIYLPLAIVSDSDKLKALFSFVTPPIIPAAIRGLAAHLKTLKTESQYIDALMQAFKGTAGSSPTYVSPFSAPVTIVPGTTLYISSGNASLPFGTQTNLNNRQMLFKGNAVTNEQTKQALLEFLRIYKLFDSVTMTTRTPVRPTSMDGTSFTSMFVNKPGVTLNDPQGGDMNNLLHIYAHRGHPLNDDFAATLHELVDLMAAYRMSIQVGFLLWGSVPVDNRIIDSASDVDIVTLHPRSEPSMTRLTRHLFTCKLNAPDAAPFSPIEWLYNFHPVFHMDFNKTVFEYFRNK